MLACSGWDETVPVFDTHTDQELLRLKGHKADVVDLVFSPDGKKIASASWDGTARIWDVKTGTSLHILTEHRDLVRCVSFSPGWQDPCNWMRRH